MSRTRCLRQRANGRSPGVCLGVHPRQRGDAMDLMAGACCGEQRGVERAYAEWFPGRCRTTPAGCSRCRRSPYKAAWHEAMKIELDGHKRPVRTKPRHRCEGGNLCDETDQDGLMVKPKTRLVAKGLARCQMKSTSKRLHQLHRQRQLKFWLLLPMSMVERFSVQTSHKLLFARNSTLRFAFN